jgi:hypothetical protein
VQRRILGYNRDGMIAGWIKLLNSELYNLYPSLNIFRMIKSRNMRGAGHVARMGEMINAYTIMVGKPEGER